MLVKIKTISGEKSVWMLLDNIYAPHWFNVEEPKLIKSDSTTLILKNNKAPKETAQMPNWIQLSYTEGAEIPLLTKAIIHRTIITDGEVYLLNNDGKTIERVN